MPARLLRAALALKDLPRAGWLRVGIAHPESVAAHSFGVALNALLLCPPGLDREKILIMALIHDLAEARVGDITPHDNVPPAEKHRREAAAFGELLADRPDLLALARELEARESPEARFIKEMDLLDMALTAEHYADRADTREFLSSAAPALYYLRPEPPDR